jgi:outer membrane protein assembly factor BamD (BamD/ComL family)
MKRSVAIACFLILSLVAASCSRKSDADLFKEGTAAENARDIAAATTRYEELVERYPATALAESSLSRLAVIYATDEKDFSKAVFTYRRYYTMFPESKYAPTMLFLSGYVFNNELHRLDSARVAYEAFLQKYPDHTLAASARYELETLGKDPGAVLREKAPEQTTAKP